MIRLIISHMAISKSICGNLKSRLKKRGILISLRREEGVVEPKFEGPPVGRGRDMCGFMVYAPGGSELWWRWRCRWRLWGGAMGPRRVNGRDTRNVRVSAPCNAR